MQHGAQVRVEFVAERKDKIKATATESSQIECVANGSLLVSKTFSSFAKPAATNGARFF